MTMEAPMSPTAIYEEPLPEWALSAIGVSFLAGFPLACWFGGWWWLSVLPLTAYLAHGLVWAWTNARRPPERYRSPRAARLP